MERKIALLLKYNILNIHIVKNTLNVKHASTKILNKVYDYKSWALI